MTPETNAVNDDDGYKYTVSNQHDPATKIRGLTRAQAMAKVAECNNDSWPTCCRFSIVAREKEKKT